MFLSIASLNSGSNGNCYYVGNEHEAVFVDAGLSCRETEKRMKRLGLPMDRVRAVFISHEHTDHIRGVDMLARKYQLPVYGSAATLRKIYNNGYKAVPFGSGEQVPVGSLSVKAFPKKHDAVDAHSFTVNGNGVTIGIFTDLGRVCDNLISHFKECHAAFLEANYDEVMLDQGRYPHFLKQRIRGGQGHLSNREALDLMLAHKPTAMSHILLAHLSKDNNNPELALDLFRRHSGTTFVAVASRFRESEMYHVAAAAAPVAPAIPVKLRKAALQQEQLSLF
jgi:phosphoribosyl 1,2-cyclic phosphodiesterase